MKLPPISIETVPNTESLFRYQVVSQVLVREATGLSRASAVEEVSAAVHITLDGQWRQVSSRSLYRWLSAFEQAGYPALAPTQ